MSFPEQSLFPTKFPRKFEARENADQGDSILHRAPGPEQLHYPVDGGKLAGEEKQTGRDNLYPPRRRAWTPPGMPRGMHGPSADRDDRIFELQRRDQNPTILASRIPGLLHNGLPGKKIAPAGVAAPGRRCARSFAFAEPQPLWPRGLGSGGFLFFRALGNG